MDRSIQHRKIKSIGDLAKGQSLTQFGSYFIAKAKTKAPQVPFGDGYDLDLATGRRFQIAELKSARNNHESQLNLCRGQRL
jgi:hypothetical protein